MHPFPAPREPSPSAYFPAITEPSAGVHASLPARLMISRRTAIAAASLGVLMEASAATTPAISPNTELATNGPVAAAEVAAKSTLPPGFRMSVFAAEPDVQQPISMATDARGRLWVAENYTYSERSVGYHPELRDRIVIFEDTDNDGRFDKRTVFWDGAQRLTSVEVGRGGAWAICLPQLLFIPDANGDDIPDGPPQVLLDGFEFVNARHTVANGLRWGPDGWLYGRQGILGTSKLGPPGTPDAARTLMNVGIWRYHPTRKAFEVVASGTTNPWGMDWDTHGEAFFINTVIGHLWHVIPGAHYRRMFGDDPTPHVYEVIEQHADHVHWAQGEVWTDVRKGVTDATLTAGGGHAHTGLLVYQGGQWPAEWNNRLLTINLHGRQLNVERLERDGSGFVGRREPDAFRFADPWFRGIDLIAAPDGGVFVSDWSDTGECHDHDGIHRTSGRIYKLSYGPARPPAANLGRLPEEQLVTLLSSSNDWEARQARQILADRAALGNVPDLARRQLRQIAAGAASEVVRLRALWSLHSIGAFDATQFRAAIRRTEYERAWAIRLFEDAGRRDGATAADFAAWVANEAPGVAGNETSALVRLTLASLLQRLPVADRPPLAQALLNHAEDASDHNLPLMLWYGIEPLATRYPDFAKLIASGRLPRTQRLASRRVADEVDAAPERLDALLTAAALPGCPGITRQAVLDGIADALAGRRRVQKPSAWDRAEAALLEGANDVLRDRVRDLAALFGDGRALEQIRSMAMNAAFDVPRRRAALEALIAVRADGLRNLCEQLLPIRDLSATAARGLALFDDPLIARSLIGEWPKLYGHERPVILSTLLSRPAWAMATLDAIADGRLRRTDVSVAQIRQLRSLNRADLNRRITEVWGELNEPNAENREATLRDWKSRLSPSVLDRADVRNGAQIFARTCGACHVLFGRGAALGPELTGTDRRNLDYLLDNILFPNAVVPPEYRQVNLTLKDGRNLSGLVRSRTERTLVLAMPGETLTVDRTDVKDERVSTDSLMPVGILDALSDTEAPDLIRFLMSSSPPSESPTPLPSKP